MRRTRAGLLAGAMLVLAACSGSASSPGPATTPTATGPPAYVLAKLTVGSKPCAVEGGFGSIWVSVYGDDVELRIDPATRKVLARVQTGRSPCGIAVGGGAVWVENYGGDSVTRIDPTTNAATTVKVGAAPYDVTFAAGAAWVTNYGDDTVTRIDAKTRKTTAIDVGNSPVGIAPAGGAVWATSMIDGTLARIDTETLKVRMSKLDANPSWTAWGDGQLWVSDADQLVRIDPRSGRQLEAVPLAGAPNDGDVVNGVVWVPDANGELHEIDPKTGKQLGSWATGLTNPFVLAGWAGKLWTVDFRGTALEEIDPAALR
ncbi:MAG: hypothetical protein QOJ03_2581 [Frankiaceae bacterium]|nr:hypothetical protein [Frankiaceae bacterium]